jgi:hypothetical protein
MIINKKCQISNVKTLATQDIRITIDLVNGTSEDIKTIYDLMSQDVTIVLTQSEILDNAQSES